MSLIGPDGRPLGKDLWILVRMDPVDSAQGEFFVSHARNYEKYSKRKGFEVIAHSYDRAALTAACRRATQVAGPAYQPKFSAFRKERPNLVGDNPDLSQAMPDSKLNSDELLDPTEPTPGIIIPDFDT